MSEQMIFKCVFGSHLYGLNTADSDMDYKAIVLPSQKDIWMQRGMFSKNTSSNPTSTKNTSEDIDMEIMSLHKFIKLACNNEMIAIDMLHVHPDSGCVLEDSMIWTDLRSRRAQFYSKDMAGFLGYVKKQAAKYSYRGSRVHSLKKIVEIIEDIPDD